MTRFAISSRRWLQTRYILLSGDSSFVGFSTDKYRHLPTPSPIRVLTDEQPGLGGNPLAERDAGLRRTLLLPALNRTMAFMHANSAGSTLIVRNRRNVSLSTRMSAATWLALPLGMAATWSDGLNNGLFSSGRHHWTAFNRNSSDQHSSSSITCARRTRQIWSFSRLRHRTRLNEKKKHKATSAPLLNSELVFCDHGISFLSSSSFHAGGVRYSYSFPPPPPYC